LKEETLPEDLTGFTASTLFYILLALDLTGVLVFPDLDDLISFFLSILSFINYLFF
jgi:hypothetical protein